MNWGKALGLFIILVGIQAQALDRYISDADKSVSVRRLSILLVSDNVEGVFSRGVEVRINDYLASGHRFDVITVKEADVSALFDDGATKKNKIKQLGNKFRVDGFSVCRIFRTAVDITITSELYSGLDGSLLTRDEIKTSKLTSTTDIESLALASFKKSISQLPYQGTVLSRNGNRVTLDLGSSDGLAVGSIVNVEEIISLKRDPVFQNIINSDKEVLGKIKVVKAEDTLSFGVILQEKARGAIQKESKIGGLDYVTYRDPSQPQPKDAPGSGLSFSKSGDVIPEKTPSFGKLGLGLGLGSFHTAASYQAQGSISGDSNLFPQLRFQAELWLTPGWFVGTELRQGILPPANPGSNNVETHTTYYDFSAGYRFLLQDDFWGPQLFIHSGLSVYTLNILNTSPFPFSSTSYKGLYIGMGGSVPLNESKTFYGDAQFNRYISPTLRESPVSSGANSDSSITTFQLGGSYKINNHFWLTAHVLYNFYSTTFSGQGSSMDVGLNSSQTDTTILTGLDYYF